MKRTLLACALFVLSGAGAFAQAPPPVDPTTTVTVQRDVLGAHDFSGTSSVTGPQANACSYCHIPHRGGKTALWNQTLSTQPYTLYTSGTSQNAPSQPAIGQSSTLCLSCHDGTVAVGQTISFGQIQMTGKISNVVGTALQGSHPFSLQLPLKDAAHLVPGLAASHTVNDPTGAVRLIDGNIECNTCHNVHNQIIDKRSPNFLVRDNTGGQLCLSCHETAARTVNGRDNTLAQWLTSVHGKSTAQVAPKAGLGGYTTVAEFACATCHSTHNAAPGSGLIRKSAVAQPTIDATSQSCLTCHDGSDNLVQPIGNVLADFQKIGHPFADVNNPHTLGEPTVLDRNRHATCADCHQPHASQSTTTFTPPPDIRPSQNGVGGVAANGSAVTIATKQYETCLRCHGASAEKQSLPIFGYLPARALSAGDALNVIPQLNETAGSAHPVMRDATMQTQPSLLKSMWDLTGKIQMRPIGTRILCTDCHNSDTNREFGGTGPNGPHGSKNEHILERQYIISKVAPASGPGSEIVNLNPSPPLDPASGGPYSLCAKCHDLTSVNSNASFAQHSRHIQAGFSCSVCHSAHGVPAGTAGVNGKRLVNFDMNVVAPRNGVVSYNGTSCTLTCHGEDHGQ